jgi:hypothetical protein
MKYLSLLYLILVLSCSNQQEQKIAVLKNDSIRFPFAPTYSINWKPGNERNALIVLNALKQIEIGNVRGAFEYYADSIFYNTNRFIYQGKKDSLQSILTLQRSQIDSMVIKPDTWLTTYYPDSNHTWVIVFYRQIWEDKKGKIDSVYNTDNVLMVNGKITELDRTQCFYPVK